MAPLGHVSFFFDGSQMGFWPGLAVARMPETPSIIVSRRSGPVGAMRMIRPTCSVALWVTLDPDSVFPLPRPEASNQHLQRSFQAGGRWSGRAWEKGQDPSS